MKKLDKIPQKPSFGIFSSAEYSSQYKTIEEKINKWFPGHKSLSPELGQELVPQVAAGNKMIGESSVINCLFTEDIR